MTLAELIRIKEILELHKQWLDDEEKGERADLHNIDLRGFKLCRVDLRKANLSGAKLCHIDLFGANLYNADLSYADLSGSDLREANLRFTNLSKANLSGTILFEADLTGANMSSAFGLCSQIEYIDSHFEKTTDGYIAYKCFSETFPPSEKWLIQNGSIIDENVNFTRTQECGCGINVAPLSWVRQRYPKAKEIWRVLIRWEWLSGVCVPYNTDGKIRCERVELLGVIRPYTPYEFVNEVI